MTDADGRSRLLYWAGVALGPLAWGVNLQGVYMLAHFSCENTRVSGAILSAVLAIVALAGTAISARAVRRGAGGGGGEPALNGPMHKAEGHGRSWPGSASAAACCSRLSLRTSSPPH